ncbi:MAG: hypothetical protein WCR16_04935 [Bacilli bacterium]
MPEMTNGTEKFGLAAILLGNIRRMEGIRTGKNLLILEENGIALALIILSLMSFLDLQHGRVVIHSVIVSKPTIEFPKIEVNIVVPKKSNSGFDIILKKTHLGNRIQIIVVEPDKMRRKGRYIPDKIAADCISIGQTGKESSPDFPVNQIEIDIRKTIYDMLESLLGFLLENKSKGIHQTATQSSLTGTDLAANINDQTHLDGNPILSISTFGSKPFAIEILESKTEKKNIYKTINRNQIKDYLFPFRHPYLPP